MLESPPAMMYIKATTYGVSSSSSFGDIFLNLRVFRSSFFLSFIYICICINTSIHLSILCEKGDREHNFIPNGGSFFFFLSFFVSHFSSNKQGNSHYFNQYRLMGERHMWISTIIGIFRIPTKGLVFRLLPLTTTKAYIEGR